MADNENTTVRIVDIARMAGVSVATVDRVIHNRGKVSEENLARINEVLRKVNYRPNLIARSLASGRQYTLAVVMPRFAQGEYWADFDAGVVAARLLSDRLDPGSDIVVGNIIHRGDGGSNQCRSREEGFRSYLREKGFRGKLHYAALRLDDEGYNREVLDELFLRHPAIAGAVTVNSPCYSLAGYLAARRRTDVRLVGYDVIRRNGQMLGAGVVTALIAQRPEAQGYRGVMALCEWLVERRRPETTVNHMPIDILLKENIQYYKNNLI